MDIFVTPMKTCFIFVPEGGVMALKPVVKLKVDELFLRWLSETETQHLLKTNLRQILALKALFSI